jgi:ankyrin repeat protein
MKAHGGDRQPLLDLLLSTGAWYDRTTVDFWQFISGSSPVSFLRRIVDGAAEMTDALMEEAMKHACIDGNLEALKYLLEVSDERGIGIDVNMNELFDSALLRGHREVAEFIFLEQFDGNNMTAIDRSNGYDRLTADDVFVYAAACGSLTIMDEVVLLESTSVDRVCTSDEDHRYPEPTALGAASDPEVIARLLDYGASVNPSGRVAVLRGACEKLRPDGVRALLAAGAPVGKGDVGKSALYYAVYAKCPEDRIGDKIAVINQLFDAGARVHDSRTGMTILHMSTELAWVYPVIPIILAREPALVHYRDHLGTTTLMAVVRTPRKHPGMVQALLHAGADPLARDYDENSVLQHLISREFANEAENCARMYEIMRMLLLVGVDPTECNRHGETLLMQVVALSVSEGLPVPNARPAELTYDARSTMLGYILDAVAAR